jgi:hypothetical protein
LWVGENPLCDLLKDITIDEKTPMLTACLAIATPTHRERSLRKLESRWDFQGEILNDLIMFKMLYNIILLEDIFTGQMYVSNSSASTPILLADIFETARIYDGASLYEKYIHRLNTPKGDVEYKQRVMNFLTPYLEMVPQLFTIYTAGERTWVKHLRNKFLAKNLQQLVDVRSHYLMK